MSRDRSRTRPLRTRPGHRRPLQLEVMEGRRLLATFTVTHAGDSGPGSLRQAILEANTTPDPDTIEFHGPDPGPLVIRPLTPLPTITEAVRIDGFSQPGSSPNTLSNGVNAVQMVVLDGTLAGGDANGLTVVADNILVQGLVVQGFDFGVWIDSAGSSGSVVQGNLVQGNRRAGIYVRDDNNVIGGTSPEQFNVVANNPDAGIWLDNRTAEGSRVQGSFILDNGGDGVRITGSNNTVGGLIEDDQVPILPTNLIIRNAVGVHIVGPRASGNEVQGNNIGLSDDGKGNSIANGNSREGVLIEDAPNNTIGRPTSGLVNIISANLVGIAIHGAGATGNRVQGNYIGTDINGRRVIDRNGRFLGNRLDGVEVASAGNLVGGAVAGARNIISGNRRHGVWVHGASAIGNQVLGNFVGTDVVGVVDLGNTFDGVRIEGAARNRVGGTAAAPSVISGNDRGISILGREATGNRVDGNLIGTTADGKDDLGNAIDGVRIEDAPGNTIGGAASAQRNIISGNDHGVRIAGADAAGNLVQGNFIGTDIAGDDNGLGNELYGVLFTEDASNNMVGGLAQGVGNTIAYNGLGGVRVESGTGDAILSNRIAANGGLVTSNGSLGIDLVDPADPASGVTPDDPNDADDGPNRLQNAPTLTAVASDASGSIIRGRLASTPDSTFTLQFFSDVQLDPSGRGEGETFLGSATVRTDEDGVIDFAANVPSRVPAGQLVTATATDAAGNTSEFSNGVSEAVGSVRFRVENFEAGEGGGFATITATRVGGSGGYFTVDYAVTLNGVVQTGLALAGADFQVPRDAVPVILDGENVAIGTLIFHPGENARTFRIPLVEDDLAEPSEVVRMRLLNPTGAVALDGAGGPIEVTLTIQDNDQPGILRFTQAQYVINEMEPAITITVVRDTGGGVVTVPFAVVDVTAKAGQDYGPTAGTLTFLPGETVKTFTVPLVDDPFPEGDELTLLVLGAPTGGATLGEPRVASLTIQNDGRDRIGPVVGGVQALAGGNNVSAVVLTFSEPLDPGRAVDPANYGHSLRTVGRDGRLGTRDDALVGLASVAYNPFLRTVTLIPAGRIPVNTPFQLAINQVTDVNLAVRGVADAAGNLLDGNGDGLAGGAYAATVVGRRTAPTSTARRPNGRPRAVPRPSRVRASEVGGATARPARVTGWTGSAGRRFPTG